MKFELRAINVVQKLNCRGCELSVSHKHDGDTSKAAFVLNLALFINSLIYLGSIGVGRE